MEVIVDRFEGDYAVVEIAIGKCVNIPRVLVPDAKEGDIIKIEIEKKFFSQNATIRLNKFYQRGTNNST